ncbi:hypothetical protein TSUD_192580 [Trifolium subterraneum]|uniref:Auxin response factor domain-containing protein n=1 Tax=Trifolium subterraneum TaxID=3900 RepID=A0A2Z6PQY1_TRISU|nr:hypothetical protein TSUD_192580 [Trifolium subterraneum]
MIPLKTYAESIERDYFIGMRVRMLLEVEGSSRRYGTIVGNEDIDPIRWPRSEWRCIKVQWDSTPNTTTQLAFVLGGSSLWDLPRLRAFLFPLYQMRLLGVRPRLKITLLI